MATATQLMPSPSGLKSMSAFSPYTDSPSSPANFAHVFSNRCDRLTNPYPATVDPSPVDSNGTVHTDHTEIEDDAQVNHISDDAMSDITSPATDDIVSPASQDSQAKGNSDDAPPSVIHAPAHFKQFQSSAFTTPIDTAVTSGPPDRSTPRAQTRQDYEEDIKRRSVRMSVNLAVHDNAPTNLRKLLIIDQDDSQSSQSHDESLLDGTQTMRPDECWTLCNSLAKRPASSPAKFYYSGGRADIQDTHELRSLTSTADMSIRSSSGQFRTNNHLYNAHIAHSRTFRERTLDFYLTLCHRLMKQRTSLPEETDSLLHACWSLAEMLFSLRQNSRDGKPADEELLGSAIQACWELCDLFREGWTQVRPDRGTPRPTQYAFSAGPTSVSQSHSQIAYSERSGRSSSVNDSYHSAISSRMATPMHPETPTTIFDDREEFSPADEPNVPNILVLGQKPVPLPDFIRALPSNSFGTIPWQSQLFESYRKLVLVDPTLRTWLARSEQFKWVRELYRFVFGNYPEDTSQRNLIINA
ncbi:hypothetical protein BKA66DRAFT_517522 [Pyrenochaeta sp. MPI-SDFR-AT-0127]|nr:hypothetical protein BKA66DRAFT_517522 [Pyrenochaeta sp. MPI-SDFR-AT-0127]